jgi:hypothetical protein
MLTLTFATVGVIEEPALIEIGNTGGAADAFAVNAAVSDPSGVVSVMDPLWPSHPALYAAVIGEKVALHTPLTECALRSPPSKKMVPLNVPGPERLRPVIEKTPL